MKVRTLLGVVLAVPGAVTLAGAAVLIVMAVHALATGTGRTEPALLDLFAAGLYAVGGGVALSLGWGLLSKSREPDERG